MLLSNVHEQEAARAKFLPLLELGFESSLLHLLVHQLEDEWKHTVPCGCGKHPVQPTACSVYCWVDVEK